VLTTPAYAFVLQSQPGVLDEVIRDAGKNPEQDAEMLRVIESIDGKPSAGVSELRKRLNLTAPHAFWTRSYTV
jgi:hypothetical protein